MKNADEVRAGEDDTQLEGELSGVGANGEFTVFKGDFGFTLQQVTPLLLDAGHLVMDTARATTNLG